jgi:hypothetical protein
MKTNLQLTVSFMKKRIRLENRLVTRVGLCF